MKKIKIIAICGKAGAGKDTLLRTIVNKYNVHEIISCTTRPIRENEVEGVNYFYLTKEQFLKKMLDDDMVEATEFNGWFYGTMKTSLDKDGWNVGVFNPEGLEALVEDPGIDPWIFYVEVSDKERLIRQLNREEHPNVKEIIRRFSTDDKDFFDMENRFSYTSLENSTIEDLDLSARIVASTCELEGRTD